MTEIDLDEKNVILAFNMSAETLKYDLVAYLIGGNLILEMLPESTCEKNHFSRVSVITDFKNNKIYFNVKNNDDLVYKKFNEHKKIINKKICLRCNVDPNTVYLDVHTWS